MKLTTDRLVNGSSCDGNDMVIKKLDLEPKDIVAEFYGPSWWKELSNEMSSKILPCGDGSCWKTFKPITEVSGMSIRFAPTLWCRIEEVHVVPYGELDGIPVAFVASAFFRAWFEAVTSPLRNAVVVLIISSSDFGMLSCRSIISLRSSSSMLDFGFFDLNFQCTPSHPCYLHFRRAFLSFVNTFLYGDVFCERIPFFLNGNSGGGFRACDTFFPLPLSLPNTPHSFLPLSPSLCLGDSDLPRLILEKTLVGLGLPDMLRELLDLRPFPCSPLTFGVLDSECFDTSCIFKFLYEHHSKLKRAFTSFSFSCCTISW
nr:hypothetical protein [Tanacetum cinerariifolium]